MSLLRRTISILAAMTAGLFLHWGGFAWPSRIPGSCSTKRDFLGELITAAGAQGRKAILYMTTTRSGTRKEGPPAAGSTPARTPPTRATRQRYWESHGLYARYVRVDVPNTHAASTDTTRYKRLRIDVAWLGSAYPATSGLPRP